MTHYICSTNQDEFDISRFLFLGTYITVTCRLDMDKVSYLRPKFCNYFSGLLSNHENLIET